MEKNQKRRSFMNRLYRAARSGGKANAKQSKSPASFTSLSSGGGGGGSLAVSSEMKSASYPNRSAPGGFHDGNGEVRGAHGGCGDENVDVKASTYILCVRERLKMERSVDWDQKVY